MNNNIEVFNVEESVATYKIKKGNKLPFLILLLVIISLLGYFFLTNMNYFNGNKSGKSTSSINYPDLILKEMTVELGEKISDKLHDYIENTNANITGYSLNITSIPLNGLTTIKTGVFQYTVYSNKKSFKGTLNVIDTIKPEVTVKKLYKTLDGLTELKAQDFVLSSKDISGLVNIKFKKSNEISKITTIGNYEVNLIATDASDNETEIIASLAVMKDDFALVLPIQDLNASYNSLNDNNWDGTYTVSFETAIDETSTLYEQALTNVNETDWVSELKMLYPGGEINGTFEVMNIYNQYGLIIGITCKTTLTENNEDKVVYFKPKK